MKVLRFEFVVKGIEDVNTNICITTITDSDGRIFAIPEELQPVRLHKNIVQSPIFQKIKPTLQKLNAKRHIWMTMNSKIKEEYYDKDENKRFMEYLLEEQIEPQTTTTS